MSWDGSDARGGTFPAYLNCNQLQTNDSSRSLKSMMVAFFSDTHDTISKGATLTVGEHVCQAISAIISTVSVELTAVDAAAMEISRTPVWKSQGGERKHEV